MTDPASDLAVWLPAQLDAIEEDIQESRALVPGDLHWSMPDWLDRRYLLADVEAKRRILDRHRRIRGRSEPGEGVCEYCSAERIIDIAWPCADVLDIASVYAGRDGYREEWRP